MAVLSFASNASMRKGNSGDGVGGIKHWESRISYLEIANCSPKKTFIIASDETSEAYMCLSGYCRSQIRFN